MVMLVVALWSSPAEGAVDSEQGKIAFGAWIPDSYEHPEEIDRFAQRVGRQPVIVSRYPSWSSRPFERRAMEAIWSRGAVPLVTWQPWTAQERGISLTAIAEGQYDGYIRRSAEEAVAWGKPVLVRLAHEMNGGWYPWGTGHGYTPATYIDMWRRVVGIFRQTGAENVQWVWCPNVNEQGGFPIALPFLETGPSHPFPFTQFYPGDKWVDWVGLDGFNWGKAGKWQSFTEIFGSSYDSVIEMTSRPIIVAETASNEGPGDKAAWITSAFEKELPAFPGIRAVLWFNEPFSGVDAPVESSATSLAAFRAAIDSPVYGLTRSQLLETPANLALSETAPAPPSGGFGQPSLLSRIRYQIHRHQPWSTLILAGLILTVPILLWILFKTRRLQSG